MLFTLVFSSLSCQVKTIAECPIDVPPIWRKPQYEALTGGFLDCNGAICMSDADSKRIVKNQATCESIRKGLIDFIDDVNQH